MSTRKHDVHSVASALKDLAAELGKPSLTGLDLQLNRPGLKDAVYREFGSMAVALQAAGLETAERAKAKQKIDNSIFEKSIEEHIAQYEPAPDPVIGPYATMAIISDIHWPFSCQRVIDRFYDYVKERVPDWVIINGDAWDMYSHAKFPRSSNVFTPREEQAMARSMNVAFWSRIHELAPKARKIQMMGNHDIRPLKRIIESYPEAEDWVREKLGSLFTFDGVETIMDPRQELFIDEHTLVYHGHASKLGDHRDATLMNTFNGHTHRGGTVWRKIRSAVLFECNSGLAGDPYAKGLTYTAMKLNAWTPGFAVQDQWGPRFVPA